MAHRWMQAESEREKHAGTKGSFRRIAQRRGMSTREASEKLYHAPGKTGKKARMAYNYMHAKRHGSAGHVPSHGHGGGHAAPAAGAAAGR